MSEVFVISDLHLGHRNILTFKKQDGTLLRPFVDLDQMHETIIGNWNRVVSQKDKIYVLGDVAFGNSAIYLLNEMNGKKRLVRGNHDLRDIGIYLKFFDEIYGVRQLNRIWLTHVPMHESSVNEPRVICNVHGHLHGRLINHPKYVNVCVEQVDYTPVNLDVIRGKYE